VLVSADAGPLALLRAVRAAPAGASVYVLCGVGAEVLTRPAAAGAVLLARALGAMVLETDALRAEAEVTRDLGLARRHATLTVVPPGAQAALPGDQPPAARAMPTGSAPFSLSVRCRIVETTGTSHLITVGRDARHHVVPADVVTRMRDDVGLLRCRVTDRRLRSMLVEVPDDLSAHLSYVELDLATWLADLVDARSNSGGADRPASPRTRALPSATPLAVGILVASRNGAGTIAETVRSAITQGDTWQAAARQLVTVGFVQDLALISDEKLRDPLVRQQIETGLLRSIRLYSSAGSRSLSPAYTEAVRTCINHGIDANTTLSWANELFRTLGVPEEQLALRSAKARLTFEVPDHHRSEASNRTIKRLGLFIMCNVCPYVRL